MDDEVQLAISGIEEIDSKYSKNLIKLRDELIDSFMGYISDYGELDGITADMLEKMIYPGKDDYSLKEYTVYDKVQDAISGLFE